MIKYFWFIYSRKKRSVQYIINVLCSREIRCGFFFFFKVPEYFIINTAPSNKGANTPGPGRLSVRPGRLSVRPVYYQLHVT